MIIEKLIIYGYGFLKNAEIELGSSLHVIYGKNEAGKSTILSFIETMLFGFPKRQQSEIQYAPKSGGTYGGKLIAHIRNRGHLTIERIRGREPEESLIYVNDKKIDESSLHSYLDKIDRPLFRQLFSTRLEHLRTMEKLQEDDLNRFLLGASLSGHLSLHEIESHLEVLRNELYRPRGRKQVINESLAELNKLADDVKKSESLKAEFEKKADEKAKMESELNRLQTEKKRLKNEKQFYEKLLAVTPLYKSIERLKLKLEQLPSVAQFPENGVERLEQIKMKLVDIEAEYRAIEKRITQLERSVPTVNEEWLLEGDKVDGLRERSEVYQLKLEQRLQVIEQIKHDERDVREFIEQIGTNWTVEKIMNANVSLTEQEKLEQLAADVNELSNERNHIERELASKRNQLKLIDTKEKELKKTLLSREEKHQLQTLVLTHDEDSIENETLFIQKIIDRYDRELRNMQKGTALPFAITLLIGIALSFYLLFVNSQMYVAIVVASLSGFVSYFIYKAEQQKRATREQILKLKADEENRLKQLQHEALHVDNRDIGAAKRKLSIDEERSKEWLVVKHNVDQLQIEYERIMNDYDVIDRSLQTKREEARQWAKRHDYPTTLSMSHWVELFHRLKDAKKQVLAIERANAEKKTLEQWIREYEHDVYEVCSIFQLNRKENVTSLLLKINRLLEEEKAKKDQEIRIAMQIEEEKKQLQAVLEKKNQYEHELKQLMQIAQCETEEEFFVFGKAWDEKQTIKDEINRMKREIKIHIRDEQEKERIESVVTKGKVNAEDKLLEREQRLREIDSKEANMMQRIAQRQVEMSAIEEGGEYDANLQKLELKKAQLRHDALDWATYTVALHLLTKTKEHFRNERLPKVIAIATAYFSKMTNGTYHALSVPVDGEDFFVESKNGVRFSPSELSRGTQEQLYLSLRLALSSVYPSSLSFPILLDDILVHFDRERRQAALRVIREHAETHQVLFFTCHEQIANECKGKRINLQKELRTHQGIHTIS